MQLNSTYKRLLVFADIISAALLILFLYTAISKLAQYDDFRVSLAQSSLLKPFAKLLSVLIPLFELIICVFLFVPLWRKKGFFLSFLFLIVVTGYLAAMVIFNPDLPCSCGGVIATLSWKEHIIFNVFFLCFSLAGLLIYNRLHSRRSQPPP